MFKAVQRRKITFNSIEGDEDDDGESFSLDDMDMDIDTPVINKGIKRPVMHQSEKLSPNYLSKMDMRDDSFLTTFPTTTENS